VQSSRGSKPSHVTRPQAAVDQIIALVNDWFRRLVGSGQPTPEGLRQREYSGNPGFRTSPEHHAALVEEARLNNLSLNAYLQLKLTPQPWGNDAVGFSREPLATNL